MWLDHIVSYTIEKSIRRNSMEKNVGTLDAYIRITLGFMMLGGGIMKKCPVKIAIGSGKIAEGITRFCPMLHVLGISTNNLDRVITNKKGTSNNQLFNGL